jgi:hypothetical protein
MKNQTFIKLNGRMPRASTMNAGFTIFEIIVSISLFVVIILMTGSLYQISQKSYNKGSDGAELTQNARVSLDRISRELRQATDIVTGLPASEIFFRDGHDISKITYIKYYLYGNNLMRVRTAYYFGDEQNVYVPYGSFDIYGDPPDELILEGGVPKIIGEYFNNLQFGGADNLINISMELAKNQNKLNIETKIYTKN